MEGSKDKKYSYFGEVWRRLKKNKVAVVSLFVILIVVIIAILAPLLAPHPYDKNTPSRSLEGPSSEFPLGTDRLGRCIFSRLIYGSRQSLQMGFTAVLVAAAVGIIIGSVAGYYGRWVDSVLMRFLDIYQGIPMFLLTVTLAAILGPSLRNAIIAIGVSMVPMNARFMRACILPIREMEYIEAAVAINAKTRRIIVRHIIPNAIPPMIVSITMGLGMAVLAGAGLSFIGLGAQPPTAEWGAMVSEGRSFMRSNPQLSVYPGLCIMITVLAFNLFGDGLRDAIDPRLKT